MRVFDSGATRDDNARKLDYRGFISPKAMHRFAEFMDQHRMQADGQLRGSDNWKLGIPIPSYVESLIRHTFDFWALYEDGKWVEAEELACAILFNVQGFLHERMIARGR